MPEHLENSAVAWQRLVFIPIPKKRWKESEVAQFCLTLCDPMDYSLPRFSVHEIFQARILDWVAISFFRKSSQPRDWTWVSRIVGRCFTVWATREVIPKKGNAKEGSNYRTIALISHASKVMLKIFEARSQQYMNHELPDIQAGFRKGRGSLVQRSNCHHLLDHTKIKGIPEKHLFLLHCLC